MPIIQTGLLFSTVLFCWQRNWVVKILLKSKRVLSARMNEKVPLCKWIKPIQDRSLTFRTEGVGYPRDVELVPFFRLHGSEKYYTVYWMSIQKSNTMNLRNESSGKGGKALLEKRTVDLFHRANATRT